MPTPTYGDVLREAEQLPPEQLLMLIERLVRRLRTVATGRDLRIAWEDAAGSAPYPLCGEDAQEWVSRSRRESDEAREA